MTLQESADAIQELFNVMNYKVFGKLITISDDMAIKLAEAALGIKNDTRV